MGLTLVFDMGVPTSNQIFTTFHLFVAMRTSELGQFGSASLATVNAGGNVTDMSPFLTADGEELWFSSGRDGVSRHIWRSPRVANGFGMPVLVPELSAVSDVPSIDQSPTLSSDRLDVYFASLRTPGSSSFDIWTSHRDSVNDEFPSPRPLDELNTARDEYPSWLSVDNCRLYGTQGSGLFLATRQPGE
jgi:hypothetical protein